MTLFFPGASRNREDDHGAAILELGIAWVTTHPLINQQPLVPSPKTSALRYPCPTIKSRAPPTAVKNVRSFDHVFLLSSQDTEPTFGGSSTEMRRVVQRNL